MEAEEAEEVVKARKWPASASRSTPAASEAVVSRFRMSWWLWYPRTRLAIVVGLLRELQKVEARSVKPLCWELPRSMRTKSQSIRNHSKKWIIIIKQPMLTIRACIKLLMFSPLSPAKMESSPANSSKY